MKMGVDENIFTQNIGPGLHHPSSHNYIGHHDQDRKEVDQEDSFEHHRQGSEGEKEGTGEEV